RRDSPAERMNLSIGDIIMDMNDQSITTREEFNERVAYNRSYVKMRIRRKDGEIVITETPLYDDDYNNLGLLILENE
ncbi:MAG TPA: PDZ domain-containing protein, partial [Atopostipes sp.]|nr:PDZ domain-containing protein [Atopostipes sp.]